MSLIQTRLNNVRDSNTHFETKPSSLNFIEEEIKLAEEYNPNTPLSEEVKARASTCFKQPSFGAVGQALEDVKDAELFKGSILSKEVQDTVKRSVDTKIQ